MTAVNASIATTHDSFACKLRGYLVKFVEVTWDIIDLGGEQAELTEDEIGYSEFFQTWITPGGLRKLAAGLKAEGMPDVPELALSLAEEADDGRVLTVGTGKGASWITVLPADWMDRLYGPCGEDDGQDEE